MGLRYEPIPGGRGLFRFNGLGARWIGGFRFLEPFYIFGEAALAVALFDLCLRRICVSWVNASSLSSVISVAITPSISLPGMQQFNIRFTRHRGFAIFDRLKGRGKERLDIDEHPESRTRHARPAAA